MWKIFDKRNEVSATGDLYVAHFDFADNADQGRIVGAKRAMHEVPRWC